MSRTVHIISSHLTSSVLYRIVCVRESRVTGILSHMLIGLSVLFIEQLKLIPRPTATAPAALVAREGNRGSGSSHDRCSTVCSCTWPSRRYTATSCLNASPCSSQSRYVDRHAASTCVWLGGGVVREFDSRPFRYTPADGSWRRAYRAVT